MYKEVGHAATPGESHDVINTSRNIDGQDYREPFGPADAHAHIENQLHGDPEETGGTFQYLTQEDPRIKKYKPRLAHRTAEWDEDAAWANYEQTMARMKERAAGLKYVTPHPGKTLAVGPSWSGSVPDGHPTRIPAQAEQDDIHGYLDHDEDGHVNFVYTAPMLRGFGVGTKLLDHAGITDTAYATRFTTDGQQFHDAIERRRTASRTAMAWDEWAPQIQGGCTGNCERGDDGVYFIDHDDPQQRQSFLEYGHRQRMDENLNPVLALHVHGLATHPNHRNDGVAEALMRRLAEDHPGVPIHPGHMTNDGQAFHDRMLDKEPGARKMMTAGLSDQPDDVTDDYSLAEFFQWCAHNHKDADTDSLAQYAAVSGMDTEDYLDIYLFLSDDNEGFR
jgi:ribosomal protein S18 acetylase RimI-like enzyme